MSSGSRGNHPSQISFHSNKSYSNSFSEEETKAQILSDSASYSQLIQEKKNRNMIQKENVQLKQQIAEERQQFESERTKFLRREDSLKEENQKLLGLIRKAAIAIGVPSNDPNFEEVLLSKLGREQQTQFEQPANQGNSQNQEESSIYKRRISELEAGIQDGQNLINSLGAEIDQKVLENKELQSTIDNQQTTIDELNSIIRQFMIASEVLDSPENAIKAVQDMRRRFKRLASVSDTARIDEVMRKFEERRANEYGRIYQEVEKQGNIIHNEIQNLQSTLNDSSDNAHSLKVYQTLQDTNQMLAERLKQLQGKKKESTIKSSSTYSSSNYSAKAELVDDSSEKYDRRGLGPSLWIAKTREMLSLERQLQRTTQRLENANRNCQCLANENLYLHMNEQRRGIAQYPLPSTLI